jgi:uncharacterized protein (TIGR03435 family)
MLQAMLAERFRLAARLVKKELPVYALAVSSNTKITGWMRGESVGPVRRPERTIGMWEFQGTLAQLADAASSHSDVGRPVIDISGVEGAYSFAARWGPDENIMTALKERYGLEFRPQKALVDTLVIDHIEKPSEN